MTNKVKIVLLWSLLGFGVALAVSLVQAVTGLWFVALPAAVLAALAARSVYWRVILTMTNHTDVVATEHGPSGRIDAIEVFWRPG